MEWAKVGKGFFAAKLQCWGGWESRALLSRRLQYWRHWLSPSWQRGSGSPLVSRGLHKTGNHLWCWSEPCSGTSSPEGA